MKRRQFLKTGGAGVLGVTALSGCLGGDDGNSNQPTTDATETEATTEEETATDETLSGTLQVSTYSAFVDSPSSSPGVWLKKEFEKQHPEVTIEWKAPESGLNHYIQRRAQNATIDADVFVGLNADDLVLVDNKLGDKSLFKSVEDGVIENASHVKSELQFDPNNRAIPYDTGYISLVYNENELDQPPKTFDDLLKSQYKGDLIVQNAQSSDPGQAFLLWTIAAKGEDGYLDYWKKLQENDVRILGDWEAAYNAYGNGEAPMVVSYSTDQVYATRYDQDLSKHQVGFLNNQGYANPEGMAKFSSTENDDLANAFLEFMLSKRAQEEIAVRNVQFPATDWAEPGEEFEKYAFTPEETVTFTYDQLKGNLNGWVDDWAKQIAGN